VVVEPKSGAAPGDAVEMVIPVSATDEAVLTVPAGALWVDAGGAFSVRTVRSGKVSVVPVTVGKTAGGYVEVSGDGLAVGATVQLHRAIDVASGASAS
jgi:multidrug efflux pump subunit AcrA (membrane-fusion protein)